MLYNAIFPFSHKYIGTLLQGAVALVCIVSMVSLHAQSSSAIQFFDSTGSNQTAKFGWQGGNTNGKFFIETPNDGNALDIKEGNLTLDGNITSTKTISAATLILILPTRALWLVIS